MFTVCFEYVNKDDPIAIVLINRTSWSGKTPNVQAVL